MLLENPPNCCLVLLFCFDNDNISSVYVNALGRSFDRIRDRAGRATGYSHRRLDGFRLDGCQGAY